MIDSEKPLVTFALFAYNQEEYIREAVEGALSQSYSPLEIIFSDDNSSDATFTIIKEMVENYVGPHIIILNKNENNLGLSAHVNYVMKISRGELIVVAAGDDISMSNRCEVIFAKWNQEQRRADLICSDYMQISKDGQKIGRKSGCRPEEMNAVDMARNGHGVTGATAAWTRRLWNKWGDLPQGIVHEDQLIPFRAILLGGVRKVDQPIVNYRVETSTWIARGTADSKEMRRRNHILAKNATRVAAAQLNDAERAEKDILAGLIRKRLQEFIMIEAVYSGANRSILSIIKFAIDGGNVRRVARAYLQCQIPFAHSLALWWRRK